MARLWTPHFSPPNPTEISELSLSAWKVLHVLEEQEKEKLRRKWDPKRIFHKTETLQLEDNEEVSVVEGFQKKNLNENSCRITPEEQIFYSRCGSSDLPPITFNQQNNFSAGPDCSDNISLDIPTFNKNELQNPSILPSQFTFNNIKLLNESVDMFDDTPLTTPGNDFKKNSEFFKYKTSNENSRTSNDSKCLSEHKKITNYFSVNKIKRIASKDSGTSSYLDLVSYANKDSSEATFDRKNTWNNTWYPNDIKTIFNTKTNNFSPKQINQIKKPDQQVKKSKKKFGKFVFGSPPDGIIETIRNLRSPFAPVDTNDGLDASQHSDDLNIGQHDESTIKACSYFNESAIDCQEGLSLIELLKNKKMSITDLSIDNQEEIFTHFTRDSIAEIGMTLCYREGFCLLNKSSRTNCVPNGILLCSKFLDGSYEMIFFSNECYKSASLQNFLLHLLSSYTRKICFDAQSMVIYILDYISVDERRDCYDWCILDPLVGAWLLDPDHPPTSLDDFLKKDPQLKVLESNDWKAVCGSLLLCQSQIMENLYSELTKEKLWAVFLYLETQIIPILAVMETSEILMDTKKLKVTSSILSERLKNIENEAEMNVGHKLFLNSSAQVRKVLYDELKLDKAMNVSIKETSIKGVKSTSEAMLKLLVKAHPLPSLILEYRQLFKLKSAYTDALFEYAKQRGSISSMWDLCSAATGRITSSNPNLQAVPKQSIHVKSTMGVVEINLRSCFLAREGHVLISVDFQHIELRVFAILAQDKDLLTLFKKNDDVFCTLTQLRLNKPQISQEERSQTKTLVYALMYGAGINKIASILSLSEMEAESIRDTFLRLFPALSDFTRKILNEVRQSKILKSISGRKRIFPNILSSNGAQRKYSERQAINFVIQGSAADICKGALLRCELELKKRKLKTKLLLQIHDELVWEVEEHDIQIFKDLILKTMEENRAYWGNKLKIDIPLPVAIRTGKEWGTMK